MIVIGIDPGGDENGLTNGYAILAELSKPRPRWLGGGLLKLDELRRVCIEAGPYTDLLVVVERPLVLFNPKANRAVLATAWVGGQFANQARCLGLVVQEVSPEQWRTALIGRPRAGQDRDELVERMVRARVIGVPPLLEKEKHALDAAGTALVGWAMSKRAKPGARKLVNTGLEGR